MAPYVDYGYFRFTLDHSVPLGVDYGSFMETTVLKSTAMFFIRYYAFENVWALLNKILCFCVAQGAAKLQEVKFEGLKYCLTLGIRHLCCKLPFQDLLFSFKVLSFMHCLLTRSSLAEPLSSSSKKKQNQTLRRVFFSLRWIEIIWAGFYIVINLIMSV